MKGCDDRLVDRLRGTWDLSGCEGSLWRGEAAAAALSAGVMEVRRSGSDDEIGARLRAMCGCALDGDG